MKSSFILFLILFAFSIASALNAFERITITSETNKCNLFKKKTYYDLLSMPGTNLKKMTLGFNSWLLTSAQCTAKVDPEIVMVSVSILVEGTRRNIIEVVPDKDKYIRVYTTDKSGSRIEVSKDLAVTTPCLYCSNQRYAVSIDLENGIVSEYGHQYNFFTHKTKTDLDYEGWVIDDSIEVTYSQAYDFSNFVIQYDTYNDEVALFDFMVSSAPNAVLGTYYTNENQGITLNDLSASKKMGSLFFGDNTATVAAANADKDPTWNKGAVKFTKTTQYVKIPKAAYEVMTGTKGDATTYPITKSSFTFTFWIKIDELPSQDSRILRYGDPASANPATIPYEFLRISLKPDGKVVTKFGGVELGATTDSLKVGEWTLLTVHTFGLIMKSAAVQQVGATTYFNNVQQTNNTELKDIDPSFTEAAYTASAKTGSYLGGFLGEVAGFNVFSPGTNRVSYPSVIPSCLVDLGYDSPVCLAKRCMDGTTTCFDPKTTPPPPADPIEEPTLTEVKKSEGYSGGTVAGIVIGTVAFVIVLGVAAFVIYYKTHVAAKLAKVRIAPEPTLPVVHPTDQTAHFMVGKTEPCDFSAMVKKGETMDLSAMIKKAEAAEAETAGLPQMDDKVSVEIPEKY